MKRFVSWPVITIALALVVVGCSGKEEMMPTPNLYSMGLREPFTDVPPELQNNKVEVIYLTDRKPEPDSTPDKARYGFGRSRSLAMGVSTVELGENLSWDQLVEASKTAKRKVKVPLTVLNNKEILRFPPTPKMLAEIPSAAERATNPTSAPTTLQAQVEEEKAHGVDELNARLKNSRSKDVYLFVHGYNNTFDDAVKTIGQLWHFMGREGVPIAYTWPAGRGGLLRGYTYDRESSEFTVFHLKEAIRTIAACPEVHSLNIIGHSRGTDVTISALRELHLEFQGGGKSTRQELKLRTVVLAAPDIDVEVVIQRMVTARLGRVPEQFAMYVCSKDKALGISNWLFSGGTRLGRIRGEMFTEEELKALRARKSVQIVDCRIKDPGPFGHSYFHANPAASSDLILLMRYGQFPGPERPLNADPKGFWYLTDDYPKYAQRPTTAPSAAP
jgi:esterase/lipase superfamily enzyme